MTRIEFFDAVACSDDPMFFGPDEHRKVQQLNQRLGDMRGARILEPGCGAGPLTEYLARWVGDAGEVFAFDASPSMVEVCLRRLAGHRNLRIERALLEEVVLERGAFDFVILFRFFPHILAKEAMLKKLRTALKREGRLIVANLEGSAELNALHATYAAVIRNDYMPSGVEIREMLERCGYVVMDVVDEPDEFYAEAKPVYD